MSQLHGNLTGLKPSQTKDLKKLSHQRVRGGELLGREVAVRMAEFSRTTNRIVGLVIEREGKVRAVVVGDHQRVYLPDIGRHRAGAQRFRGIRLVRTSLKGKRLSGDDVGDLTRLRLDLVASFEVDSEGRPGGLTVAHLLPANPENRYWESTEYAAGRWFDVDFEDQVRELEDEFEHKAERGTTTEGIPAMLVYVRTPDEKDSEERIGELEDLCRTAGIDLVDTVVQARPHLDPRFGVGPGKFEDLLQRALQLGVEFLVFGQDLLPRQLLSISEASQLKVIDRTQLILDIFAQHAHTQAGRLQVELAQLKYALPRLAKHQAALSRLTGGIGGRGPGETKLEIHKRRARDRIRNLESSLADLSASRQVRRSRRQVAGIPVVSLVGYTNAGKSTLLNTLTRSSVRAEDRLFSTLDPTSRRIRFPDEREIILTDTVGFLRDLPADLVAAFKATLEEMEDATTLLHVVDVSREDFEDQMASVETILDQIGLGARPRLLVFNKIDLVEGDRAGHLAELHGAFAIEARRAETTLPLVAEIHRIAAESSARSPSRRGPDRTHAHARQVRAE